MWLFWTPQFACGMVSDSPTVGQWLQKVNHVYVMECITVLLQLKLTTVIDYSSSDLSAYVCQVRPDPGHNGKTLSLLYLEAN